MAIRIDYSLATEEGSRCGITIPTILSATQRFETVLATLRKRVNAGEIGFWSLPATSEALVSDIEAFAAKQEHIKDVLILGIGGSALGARAMYEALGGPPELREGRRLHFVDNADPWRLNALMQALQPKSTLALVVSKSGGTVETAAAMLIVREWFRAARLPLPKHLVAITDPSSGSLRALADAESLSTFPIPKNVGGRFSILTAVGLLPAALAGFDIRAMLAGAERMRVRCEDGDLKSNPAGLLAVLHVMHHRLFDRRIHVLMPYAEALRPFADWYVQLWAESLGKRSTIEGELIETGPTPLPAVGATDQHAQVQLFMEGPRDKLVTFIRVAQMGDRVIPTETGASAYLGGHSMVELLHAEQRGTALALAQDRRPSLLIDLPVLDAAHLGELFFLWEAATAFAGEFYRIDTFDQPGVELGKRLAFALLGRAGYETEAEEIRRAEEGRQDLLV